MIEYTSNNKTDRPVKCFICKEKMFYKSEDGHEPEYCFLMGDNQMHIIRYGKYKELFAHKRCVSKLIDQ